MNVRRISLLGILLTLIGFGGRDMGPAPLAALQANEGSGEIRGRILGRRGSSLTPLPNALVQIVQGRRVLTAVSDAVGRYRIPGLPGGRWTLQALHVGYDELSAVVLVPRDQAVTLDVELPWKPVELRPVRVVADPLPSLWANREPPPYEMGELLMRTMEAGTGMVEAGLAAVAQGTPGHDPSDPRDVLLMRGSAADMKLVLLDGAPVYTPFHMGGLVESLDPWALGGASMFLGGAPARFDGGLSYIMDLRTRRPSSERVRGRVSADFMSASTTVEGPLPGTSGFLLSSRFLHEFGAPVLGRGGSPYGYGDLLGRVDWDAGEDSRLFLTGFWNQEDVDLDLSSESATLSPQGGGPPSASYTLGNLLPDGRARWGNSALVAGLDWGKGYTRAEARLAASRYEARLPLGDSIPFFAHGNSGRIRATLDFSRGTEEGDALRFGASFDRLSSSYYAKELDPTRGVPDAELDSDGITGGAYVETVRRLTPNLTLRAGLRADDFSTDPGLRLAPRISLSWLLTDAALLTVAAGRYHQYSTLPIEELREAFDSDTSGTAVAPAVLGLGVGASNHLLVSLDQQLAPGMRLGLEGFVKEFEGISGAAGTPLHASGVDLRVARQGDRASGWLGYTLTWFWSSEGNLVVGESRFSGRHLLSAGLSARLTDRTGVLLRIGYGDGLPYTSIPLFGSSTDEAVAGSPKTQTTLNTDRVLNDAPGFSAGPDQGFLRVDAELFSTFNPDWFGRNTVVRPYLKVLNALNRRDALFYHFERWREEGPRPLADLPLLPVLGVEWRF